jgi:trigger factor
VARPGFRKGKVPRELLERDFGARIQADALEKLIPAVCHQAIEQEGLDAISVPNVKTLDLEHPQMVRLDVELDVRPRLPALHLESLRVEAWKPEVRDADVDSAMERLRHEQAQFVSVQREVRDGDFVVVSYVPLDDTGRERAAMRVENYPFQVGDGQVVAEFESAVRGLVAGQTARANVQYAPEHENKEVAGKLVAFLLTLKDVKEKRLPALDDDLARDLGLDGLDALRQHVRADLAAGLERESERDVREKLVDALLAANPFEAPRSMVERYLEAVVAEVAERHQRLQRPFDAEQRQALRQSARPAAERAARRALLLEHLAAAEQLRAGEEDVDRWIEEKVQADDPEAARLRRFLALPERRRTVQHELTEEKVFAFVKAKAQIVPIPRP